VDNLRSLGANMLLLGGGSERLRRRPASPGPGDNWGRLSSVGGGGEGDFKATWEKK
jgi:hypothetical protein